MKTPLAMLLCLLCGHVLAQYPEKEDWEVGGRYSVDQYYVCNDVMWHIMDLDEGVSVAIEKGGAVMSFTTNEGIFWANTGCGFNERTGTFDERTLIFTVVSPPIMIPEGSKVHFTCPPNGYAHMVRTKKR